MYFVSTDEELLSLKVVVVEEGNSPPPRNIDVVDSIENPLLAPPAIHVVREDILAIRRRDVANIMDSSSDSRVIIATNEEEGGRREKIK